MTQVPAATPPRTPRSRKPKPATKALILLVIAVLLGGGIFLQLQRTTAEADGYGSPRSPARITGPGVVSLGVPGAPHTVEVYEDPLCPYCSLFEGRFGQLLAKVVDEGKARVTIHLLTFLDDKSASRSYSTRAGSAMLCAIQADGTSFGRLHQRLMSAGTQPKENGTADLTDEELSRLAVEAGARSGIAECLRNGTYSAVLRQTTAIVRPTIAGTPTVRIDDELVEPGDVIDGDWTEPLR